jgi:two-component system, cell cycle response regulator
MSAPKSIFAFFSSDEMRHPYDAAVASLGAQIRWFPSLDSLLWSQTEGQTPLAVFIDLDTIPGPWELQLEAIRSVFPDSELIGLSSADSANTALRCIRCGFTDFLLKPVSPEEIAWSLRRAEQRAEMMRRLEGPRARLIRALTQISSSTSVWLLRLCTLEFLQQTLGAEGAAWLDANKEMMCGVPRRVQSEKIQALLPRTTGWDQHRKPRQFIKKRDRSRKIYLSCQDPQLGGILLWGIKHAPGGKRLSEAKMLWEHAQVCLLNLEKFDEVKQRTFIDDLTGLYNSRYLKYALTNAIVRSSQNARHFAVLFIDVDHFKGINDKHGHLVGSALLVAIGKAVKNCVRNIDPVFRYGGDEFVVILHDTTKEGAREIGERLRKQIERRVFVVQGAKLQTTVSVGIAVYPDHTMERDTLLRLADSAMYSVKRESRNAVHMAFPEPEAAAAPKPPELR